MPPETDNRDERKAVVAATEPTLEGTFHASQMSALGQEAKFWPCPSGSGLPPTCDIRAPKSAFALISSTLSPVRTGEMTL